MTYRTRRFLMFWLFFALQAMTPFIHAHAGAVHLNHAGFLHLHQDIAHGDTAWHTMTADEHGTEVAVATGLPARSETPVVPAAVPAVVAPILPQPAVGLHPGVGLPAPPRTQSAPGYTLPFALAPPAV